MNVVIIAFILSLRSLMPQLLIARKHVKQDSNVNEEWKSMFGSLEPSNISQPIPKGHGQTADPESIQAGKPLRSESSAGICAALSSSPQVLLKNTIFASFILNCNDSVVFTWSGTTGKWNSCFVWNSL